MKLLKGEHIHLRALEPRDLEFLYALENDPGIWEVSGTLTPYSRKVLRDYLETSHRDIYEVKQLRLAICACPETPVGLIDLYDFDPKNLRAGLGIVISEPADRDRGYGAEAIALMTAYAFEVLGLHQLYASVGEKNVRSRHLFEKLGFVRSGVRRQWLRTASGFEDEWFYQKIRENVS
ncbi:MAG: GNAT family N-acetyltransferase [Robiginitalea sp.]